MWLLPGGPDPAERVRETGDKEQAREGVGLIGREMLPTPFHPFGVDRTFRAPCHCQDILKDRPIRAAGCRLLFLRAL